MFSMNSYIFYEFQIAVLDVDICGPSIPKVMGLEGEQVKMGWLFLFFILYFKCI